MRWMLPVAKLCLALWTGALICVMFAVAPSVFAGIPEPLRNVVPPGDILRPVFRAVDLFGIATMVLYLLATLGTGIARRRFFAVSGMGLGAAVNVFVLAPLIRESGGRGLSHGISMALGLVIAAAGVAVTFVDLRRNPVRDAAA